MSLSLAWYNNKDHKTFSVTYLGLSSEMAIKTIFNEMMTSKYTSIPLPEYIRQYMISWGIEIRMNSFHARMNSFQTRRNSFYVEGRLE